MNWQGTSLRFGPALARLRSRLQPRLVGRVLGGGTALALLVICAEATFRVRLDPPAARVPTTIYTRPVAWPAERGRRAATPIGSVAGALAERRIPVRLRDVPDHLVDAVLAVEDQRFFDHHGLDFRRIAGAAVANLQARGIVQGGSTVTQQLAKNLYLSARRTPLRKLREAAMAFVLERDYEKSAILEAYLNEIYLGQDGALAIHGVGAAASYYFGKDIDDISLAESALLAGMIRAPNRYAPTRHPRDARTRRDLVLGLMAEQDRVSDRAAGRAMRARVNASPHPARVLDARYFRDFATRRLGRLPARGGAVYTTLDATLQRAAERAVADGLGRIRSRDAQAALVALDPRTGDVLALVGGRDYGTSQFDRATDARRQPGSAFKPIVALAALQRRDDGIPAFTLASVIDDEPLSVATRAGRWEPRNYDREFRGPVTFREALEQSLNVPFARIGLEVGSKRIVETARQLGIRSPLRAVPSLALGSSEVTLLELTSAYGVFAAGGSLAPPRTLLGLARDGDVSEVPEPVAEGVADPAAVYLVTSALEGVVTRGTGRGLDGRSQWGGVAGKSGTSNDWRDAWFVAYTRDLVVGVWVGHDDGSPLRLTGAQAGIPIVGEFLREALRQAPARGFRMPDGVEIARVASSGYRWTGLDCAGEPEVFLEGTAPADECDGFRFRGWSRDHGEEWARLDELAQQIEDRAEVWAERLIERARRLLER